MPTPMQSWNALPDRRLIVGGEVTAEFLALGIDNYRTGAHHISQLPYGRNGRRANFRLVLKERRGTCSTKHALLAALAIEQQLAVQLTLGIYEMHERNTPGVGATLNKYRIAFVPEAHCYLTYDGIRVDVTRGSITPVEPIASFLREETISPAQIGDYKVEMHKSFIREWSARETARSWEEIWKIREDCIAALSQSAERS
ncbi:MAG TPA: hypothetical protein VN867_08750 [Candidatus Binataceae bacterium]|nr:hypothetical protein [Candidatus Binataceae bacterium]